MGEYLSMKESAKADPVLQTQPDENYAREVMQLFSIGTVMLNIDGSVQARRQRQADPDVQRGHGPGLRQGAVGLDLRRPGSDEAVALAVARHLGCGRRRSARRRPAPRGRSPMQPWTAPLSVRRRHAHDHRPRARHGHQAAAASIRARRTARCPRARSPQTDLDNVIDNLFNHPERRPVPRRSS